MQLEPEDEKKPLPPAEQIGATTLELQLAVDMLGGLAQSRVLPLAVLRALGLLEAIVSGGIEELHEVHAVLLAKPPRPAPVAAPPARVQKKTARPHTRAPEPPAPTKPQRSNGAGPGAPGPSEAPAKSVP